MAQRIAGLIADPASQARVGAAARRFVLDHHGWEAMLAPLANLIGVTKQGVRHAA